MAQRLTSCMSRFALYFTHLEEPWKGEQCLALRREGEWLKERGRRSDSIDDNGDSDVRTYELIHAIAIESVGERESC